MRIFILKTSLFVGIICVVDFACGILFDKIWANAKGGATFRDRYICNNLETDILLLGSSRCEHHYNPVIISDSLNLSCYNAGQSGNGIFVTYARYLMIRERKKPYMVVCDINPPFDLLSGYDNRRYLTWLRSYYKRDYISGIFEDIDKTEKYKMLSNLYRYNSRIIEIIVDNIHPIFEDGVKGYIPYKSKMDKKKISLKELNHQRLCYEFDSLKLYYIDKFIDAVGESNIIFVVSPRWYGMDKKTIEPLFEICKKRQVMFVDFSNSPKYVQNDTYFKDGNHLNATGADEFTRDLIKYLKYKKIMY